MKHKHWGSLTKQPGTEYQTNVVGSHGGSPSGKFLGQTGGHIRHGSKLNHNRSS